MTIDASMIDNAVYLAGTLFMVYWITAICANLLIWAFSDKFVVTITYSWSSITESKSFGVKAINEDYAIIKAFKKFSKDEPVTSSFDLRNIKSYQVTKLK